MKEKNIIALLLFAVLAFVVTDLFTDAKEQLSGPHLFIEVMIGVLSFLGIIFLYRISFLAKAKLSSTQNQLESLQVAFTKSENQKEDLTTESQKWKAEAEKHILGLSQSIDLQLEHWKLSPAEKDVALLILKGLSLKEIAHLRNVSEKTIRAQSVSIYTKSGLGGRSELAAFFLEDLLSPKGRS
ncbi:MAG TPA: LuxR C-terminal-related transcriptional regulator [Pseudobdellovibrionaceae bacterium]|nr:LuxR C-terminal-related transcriptional regulator [Pseudobdellovibrionaceae bacterium]